MTAVAAPHRRGDRPHRGRAAPAAAARPDPRRAAARRRRAHAADTGLRVLAARRPERADGRAAAAGPVRRRRARATPAVAELLSSTLLTGTATRDRVEIDDELAAVGADLGVSVDPERLSIGGSGLAAGLADAARRARRRAHRAPPTPTPRWRRERDRLVERITRGPRAAAHDRPGGAAAQAVRRPPDHPARCPPADEVAAVDRRRRCGRCTRPRWCRAASILMLVGDIDPAAAIGAGRRRAGRLDRPSGRPASCRRRRRSTPGDLHAGAPARLGAVAAAAVRAGGAPRRPRYAALQLANLVFGGYFSSRWMENIREDKGYTYGAHSGIEFDPGRGGARRRDRRGQRRHRRRAAGDPLRAGPAGRRAADRGRRSTPPAPTRSARC